MRTPLTVLTWYGIKGYVRNRGAMFFALLVPLMIMVIFGLLSFGGSPSVNVGVVDQAHNQLSGALLDSLRDIKSVKLHSGSLDDEKRALEKGDRDLVVILPPTLGQGPTGIPALYNQGKPQESQIAQAIMTRFLDQASFRVAGVQPGFTLDAQPIKSRNLTYVDFLVPGMIAMSVMQTGLFSVVFGIVQLKQRGVLRRLMATPVRVFDVLISQVTTRLVMAAVQTVVLLAVGLWLFHFHFSGNVLYLLLLGVIGSAIFIAMGFAISGYARNEETAAPIANLISLPMMFLSGIFFPRSSMPAWLQPITDYFPLTYVADALRKVSVDGATLWAVRWDLVGIGGWLAISIFIATRLFRWEVT